VFESFPTVSDNTNLANEDFQRFSSSYAEILQKYLPVAKRVVFISSAAQAELYFKANVAALEMLSLFRQVQSGVLTFGIHADTLMLPFAGEEGEKSVAIVSEADPLFLQKVSEDWLLEIKAHAEKEFLLLKQGRVDGLTGLLNMSNLYYLLDRWGLTEGFHLILLELTPKRTSFHHCVRYAHKCATLLLDFVHRGSVLHFLGQSTFALVLQHNQGGEWPEIESALVSYLKREGCHRVHIGSSFNKAVSENADSERTGRQILDEAWTALRHAAKRGPFSFCDFSLFAHPENHPLAPPDKKAIRRLSKLWSGVETFCLVQFAGDSAQNPAVGVVLPNITKGETVFNGDDVFVYLAETKAEEALNWAKEVIAQTENPRRNIYVSAGISSYPYSDFKKSEMVFNCRKALLHAAFYGKSSAAIFDAVSLNISGDIYFNDGDLEKAVQEYKRGLKCDQQDVNLHNSLGVALAMMNKLTPAMQSFENGLALDGENFMALYNLGLGEQGRNRKSEALMYLEKALQHYSDEDGGAELINYLTLQLGILSCELGKYEAALAYLVRWQPVNNKAQSAGRVHYYLGKAFHGLNNNRKATEALQRALRFDALDDRAMNLLGRIYLAEGEGNEIALSLCRKSVELEPSNVRYMLYLAEVLLRCGFSHEARKNLYRCLKNRDCKLEAQLLLGEIYAHEGQYRRAKNWFDKVLAEGHQRPELTEKAEELMKNLSYAKK